ncbi:unknown [Bacteroides sp. CAG:633]|nr:unknown [Bacteroides sp. CAG:633]
MPADYGSCGWHSRQCLSGSSGGVPTPRTVLRPPAHRHRGAGRHLSPSSSGHSAQILCQGRTPAYAVRRWSDSCPAPCRPAAAPFSTYINKGYRGPSVSDCSPAGSRRVWTVRPCGRPSVQCPVPPAGQRHRAAQLSLPAGL